MDLQKEFVKINEKIEELKSLILNEKEEKKQASIQALPELLGLKQAASLLGITTQTLHNKRKNGEIQSKAIGHKVYITRDELQRYINTGNQFSKPKSIKK